MRLTLISSTVEMQKVKVKIFLRVRKLTWGKFESLQRLTLANKV